MIEKACRRCAEVLPMTEFYGEHKTVRCNKTGKKITKLVYKHKCKSCESEMNAKRKKYTKDNRPKKPVRLANDMKWAFSRVLEGVFYNRPNRKIKEETF
jgi:NAD-dependent dihydropyrimidine dehydrogenase PreA subunit